MLWRVIDGLWPFPAHLQLVPQSLAALDLLEYPDPVAQRIGRAVLRELPETAPSTLARRGARAWALDSPRVGNLQQLRGHHPAPLIVIWDNGPAHGGDPLRTYLSTPDLHLRLVRLPASSPDFNLGLGLDQVAIRFTSSWNPPVASGDRHDCRFGVLIDVPATP